MFIMACCESKLQNINNEMPLNQTIYNREHVRQTFAYSSFINISLKHILLLKIASQEFQTE
jgi:hypothetical protein